MRRTTERGSILWYDNGMIVGCLIGKGFGMDQRDGGRPRMHVEVLQDEVDSEFQQWHLEELMQGATAADSGQQGPSLSGGRRTIHFIHNNVHKRTAYGHSSDKCNGGTSGTGPTDTTEVATRQVGMAAPPVQWRFGMGWAMNAFKWTQMRSSTKGAFQTSSIPDNDGFVRAPRNPPPPLVHPPSIRRELLRRLSQKRDHFFDIGKLLARSNPALAHAFYSTEVSSQPSCASQYIRGTAEWLYRGSVYLLL
uniref:Uncharacterized protein n=1 Tax=Globodera rostochiensis TaxID=31243 RepID=A0A914H807_GLORO